MTCPDGNWNKPEYAAAYRAWSDSLNEDANDKIAALSNAVDAAIAEHNARFEEHISNRMSLDCFDIGVGIVIVALLLLSGNLIFGRVFIDPFIGIMLVVGGVCFIFMSVVNRRDMLKKDK